MSFRLTRGFKSDASLIQRQAERVEAIALMVDFLDLLDGDTDAEPEEDADAEEMNSRVSIGRSHLGPGDLDDAEDNADAEPDDEDTGAAEDEGVGPFFQAQERVGCHEFDGT